MNLSSKLLEDAVNAFATLPGIGKKTALRLSLHLLHSESQHVENFCKSIQGMRTGIQFCATCHHISDEKQCGICSAAKRDKSVVCIVESIRDVMAIENTQHYHGVYHVLGGIIAPVEGIRAEDLNIASLIERVETSEIKEVIMALGPNIESEITIHYISKKLKSYPIRVSIIARGVSGELEYADEMTLGRSILSRIPYPKD